MKSSIKIALDENRLPVIEFNVVSVSDDLRDHVCQDFIRMLGGESNTCSIEFKHNIGQITKDGSEELRQWIIRPIPAGSKQPEQQK